jgi:hypothetical protein
MRNLRMIFKGVMIKSFLQLFKNKQYLQKLFKVLLDIQQYLQEKLFKILLTIGNLLIIEEDLGIWRESYVMYAIVLIT